MPTAKQPTTFGKGNAMIGVVVILVLIVAAAVVFTLAAIHEEGER